MRRSHKSQHWVPSSYLSSWIDPDTPKGHTPYLNVISKDGLHVSRRAPVNTFKETDLYTISLPDGSRDLRLEHGLSELETSFGAMRRDFLAAHRSLPPIRLMKLLLFVAAMHARTPRMRDHLGEFWNELKRKGEALEAKMLSKDSRQKQSRIGLEPASLERGGIGLEEVRELAANAMQSMLEPFIAAEFPLLTRMKCIILCTENDPGFITSDDPVSWFDPEWHKKPPLFRSPAFVDPKLEITFPLSPHQMLMLMHGDPGISYQEIPVSIVSDLNRRTRFLCHKQFVVKRAYLEPSWFDPGTEPDDSWERTRRSPNNPDAN
jgi:hypothetical protein